jgi:hypothetical protein
MSPTARIEGAVRQSNLVAVRPYRRRQSKIANDLVRHAATVLKRMNIGENPVLA